MIFKVLCFGPVTLLHSPDIVPRVLIDANELNHLVVEHEALLDSNSPWLCIGFGIINRDLDFQVAEVWPAESFSHFGGIRQRIADNVEPAFIIETGGLNYERVAVPLAHRVTVPPWLCVRSGQ